MKKTKKRSDVSINTTGKIVIFDTQIDTPAGRESSRHRSKGP